MVIQLSRVTGKSYYIFKDETGRIIMITLKQYEEGKHRAVAYFREFES